MAKGTKRNANFVQRRGVTKKQRGKSMVLRAIHKVGLSRKQIGSSVVVRPEEAEENAPEFAFQSIEL
jgi:hypothetical protein